jgi:chitinase
VEFITANHLDGVDFDWEYPGVSLRPSPLRFFIPLIKLTLLQAQDIPGIPPDSTDSGKNYLEFLKLVRSKLPSDKTMSIAAPASYWYLKSFPIKEIADVVVRI